MKIKVLTLEKEKEAGIFMQELYRDNYRNAYKVIIAEGEDFNAYEYMSEKLNELFWNSDVFEEYPIKIISGMDKRADTLAIRYAD